MKTPQQIRDMSDDMLQEFLTQVAEVVHAAEYMSEVDRQLDFEYEAGNPALLKDSEHLAEKAESELFRSLLDDNMSGIYSTLSMSLNPHIFGESCPLH